MKGRRLTGPLKILPHDQASWRVVESRRGLQPLGAPSGWEGGVAEGGNVISFPPTIFPPPGAKFFYGEASVVAAAGPVTLLLAGLTVQLPSNTVGVVREITLNINNMLVTTNVRWRLRFNGATVPGMDLTIFPRAAASVSSSFSPEDTLHPTPDGAQISVEIQVIDGGAYQLGASYRGWFFSKDVALRMGYGGFMG